MKTLAITLVMTLSACWAQGRVNAPDLRPEACVLVSEKWAEPLLNVVYKLVSREEISRRWKIRFFSEAQLDHVIGCVKDDRVKRVLWVAHGSGAAGGPTHLHYIQRVPSHLRESQVMKLKSQIQQELHRLALNPSQIPFEVLQSEVHHLQTLSKNLDRADFILYDPPKIIFNEFFERRVLPAIQARNIPLDRFSLLACNREAMLQRYPSLKSLEKITQFDLAPTNRFASWLMSQQLGGKKIDVSSTDPEWIQAQFE